MGLAAPSPLDTTPAPRAARGPRPGQALVAAVAMADNSSNRWPWPEIEAGERSSQAGGGWDFPLHAGWLGLELPWGIHPRASFRAAPLLANSRYRTWRSPVEVAGPGYRARSLCGAGRSV